MHKTKTRTIVLKLSNPIIIIFHYIFNMYTLKILYNFIFV